MVGNVFEKLLETDEKVVNVIDDKWLKSTLPKECLRECVSSCASEYKKEVLQLLKVILPHLATGFSAQQGALFSFGARVPENTGTIIRISSVTDEAKRRKLNRLTIHNLNEERSVGFINYEIHIRGKQWLESAKKMIINKSIYLLETSEPVEIKKFQKPSKETKDIKMQWKEKIKAHQGKTYSDKEKSFLKEELTKYNHVEKNEERGYTRAIH